MNAIADQRADNLKGALFMAISMAAFVVNDTLMKSLAGEVPLFQAVFVRGLFATVLVGIFALQRGVVRLSALAPEDRLPTICRGIAEVGATVCFLNALFNIPLANATAILQATPIVLTFIGAVFLRETVGWRRWAAVLLGFLGVLLIVRPGTDGFNLAALWAVAAVVFISARDLITLRLSRTTPSLLITLITAISITTLGGLITAIEGWEPITQDTVLVLAFASLFLFGGYLFSVMTMRVGEMAFTSPFRYTILIWALILGWLVFDETPAPLTLVGAAIIAAAGLYTFVRERRLKKAP